MLRRIDIKRWQLSVFYKTAQIYKQLFTFHYYNLRIFTKWKTRDFQKTIADLYALIAAERFSPSDIPRAIIAPIASARSTLI